LIKRHLNTSPAIVKVVPVLVAVAFCERVKEEVVGNAAITVDAGMPVPVIADPTDTPVKLDNDVTFGLALVVLPVGVTVMFQLWAPCITEVLKSVVKLVTAIIRFP
jgi:hypothetical protein